MINDTKYITTKLKEKLGQITLLNNSRPVNLVAIVIGIINSKSVIASDIASELKDDYSEGKEPSKIKRIYRFFGNTQLKPEINYYYFVKYVLENYKPKAQRGKINIIIDYTTVEDKFLILQMILKVGKRAIPLWYKIFHYKDKNNQNTEHVIEGLLEVYSHLENYKYDIVVLADRGFKNTKLFEFVEKKLGWKYCIRCTKDVGVKIAGNRNIKKLQDIKPRKNKGRHFNSVKLTMKEFECNLSVCRAEGKADTWYLIHNIDHAMSINEYKKRFEIEEMFRDLKSNGFNLEDTWTRDLNYIRNLYFCLCIAYTWMIILGAFCSKNKKNNLLGAVKKINNKIKRIYSLFTSGLKWFKRCFNASIDKYYLCFNFTLYEP